MSGWDIWIVFLVPNLKPDPAPGVEVSLGESSSGGELVVSICAFLLLKLNK